MCRARNTNSAATLTTRAGADIKFILIAGFCLSAVFGFYWFSRQEKYALRRQLDEALKKKDTMEYQRREILKTVAPLKEELEGLKKRLFSNSNTYSAEEGTAAPSEQKKDEGQLNAEDARSLPLESKLEPKKARGLPAELKSKKTVSRNSSSDSARSNSTQKGLNRLKEYVKNLEGDNASLKDRITQLNAQLDSKDVELLKLNSGNTKLSSGLESALKANDALKVELETNVQSLSNLKSQLTQRESEAADFNKTKSGLEKQVNELNNKLASLTAASSTLEKQTTQYQQDRFSLEKEISRLKEELGRQASLTEPLNKKISELSASLGARDSELANLTKELLQVKEAKSASEAELNQLKLVSASRQEQANQLNLRINESKSAYENLKGTTDQLSSFLNKKELELTERQTELHSLRDNFEKVNQEKSNLESDLKDKEKTIVDLNASVSGLQSKLASLEDELAAPKKLQTKTVEQLNELTSVSNFLQDKLTGISKELGTLNTQAESDKKKALELKKRVEVMLDVEKAGDNKASIKEERF